MIRPKQNAIYSLTETAIELVPVLAHIGAWGRKHLPASEELSIQAEILENGGPLLWDQFMRELRQEHLSRPMAEGDGIEKVGPVSWPLILKGMLTFRDPKFYLFFTSTVNGRRAAKTFL